MSTIAEFATADAPTKRLTQVKCVNCDNVVLLEELRGGPPLSWNIRSHPIPRVWCHNCAKIKI